MSIVFAGGADHYKGRKGERKGKGYVARKDEEEKERGQRKTFPRTSEMPRKRVKGTFAPEIIPKWIRKERGSGFPQFILPRGIDNYSLHSIYSFIQHDRRIDATASAGDTRLPMDVIQSHDVKLLLSNLPASNEFRIV